MTWKMISLSTLILHQKVDSSYYFRNMAELELEEQEVVETATACDYGKQFICPNCGEPFDGHECENCKYTEER